MYLNVRDMLGAFFDVSWLLLNTSQTDERIKESDQERQRNAEKVEDLQKQLSKAAAEACLHWLAHTFPHCVGNIVWPGSVLTLERHRCRTQCSMIGVLRSFFDVSW